MQPQEEASEQQGGRLFIMLRPWARGLLVAAGIASLVGFIPAASSVVLVIGSSVVLKCFTWIAIILSALAFVLMVIASLEDPFDGRLVRGLFRLTILAVIIFALNYAYVTYIDRPWKVDVSEPNIQGDRTVELYYTVYLNETLIVTYEVGPQSIIAHQTGSEYGFERRHKQSI